MSGRLITITLVKNWRDPQWDAEVPSRDGWIVTCAEHGDLGKGWTYRTSGIAQSVGTRHVRAHHKATP